MADTDETSSSEAKHQHSLSMPAGGAEKLISLVLN